MSRKMERTGDDLFSSPFPAFDWFTQYGLFISCSLVTSLIQARLSILSACLPGPIYFSRDEALILVPMLVVEPIQTGKTTVWHFRACHTYRLLLFSPHFVEHALTDQLRVLTPLSGG